MPHRVCLIHYHEIGLKGKNRSRFENQLVVNLRQALRAYPIADIRRVAGHIVITTTDGQISPALATCAAQVPGVARVSRAFICGLDEHAYCEAAVMALSEAGAFETFKVHARRSATNYELHTLDIHRLVGGVLCDAFPHNKVKMHDPDVTVFVLVSQANVYVYADAASEVGVGGLPVGTAGKVVSLLSSGFDSPVATWMVGRRGAVCVPVHFSGRPMTADTSEWLCQDVIEALSPAGIIGRLYVVPFGEHQRQISLAVPQALRVIMYRRIMMQVAERIALIEGAKALVTGESLGQVASQTLDNIAAVNECVSLPILRPLIGSDKQEIMRRAEQIGTHDISIQTAPDCCTLFMPRRPETHAKIEMVHTAWESFDHEGMVSDLVDSVEWRDFDSCVSYRPPHVWSDTHTSLSRFSTS